MFEQLIDPTNAKACTTQMVPFTYDLTLTLNNTSKVDVIYFDFAKAFDSVSHDLVLKKLKHEYKIDGLMLRFIKSYLQGRQQQVVIGLSPVRCSTRFYFRYTFVCIVHK